MQAAGRLVGSDLQATGTDDEGLCEPGWPGSISGGTANAVGEANLLVVVFYELRRLDASPDFAAVL